MSERAYKTIDPLILETLNLNERRMNHILDILHGREQKDPILVPKTERSKINKFVKRDKSLSSIEQTDKMLPSIVPRHLVSKNKEEKQNQVSKTMILKKEKSKKSIDQQDSADSLNREKRKESLGKQKQQQKRQSNRNNEETIDIDKQIIENRQLKRYQVMKDYMNFQLHRSRSQEINSRDIYRIQIEALVSELTPIELLQQAQKKMKRLKRRHKHLVNFDRNYYSKLTKHDLVVLA